jgi:hypothetical protein
MIEFVTATGRGAKSEVDQPWNVRIDRRLEPDHRGQRQVFEVLDIHEDFLLLKIHGYQRVMPAASIGRITIRQEER